MRVTPTCDTINSFVICNAPGVQMLPDAVFNGENYIAVWTDTRFDTITNMSQWVMTGRVTPDGVSLDTGVVIGLNIHQYEYHPQIAFDGDRCLAVWYHHMYEPFGIYGRFINSSGRPEDTVITIATPTGSMYSLKPRVAFDGTNYLVTYGDKEPDKPFNFFGQFVSPAGELIGDKINIGNGNVAQSYHDLAWDGDLYIVVWIQSKKIFGQRVDTNGRLRGPKFRISDTTSNSRQYPAVDGFNFNYLVAWGEDRDPDITYEWELYGTIVSDSVSPSAPYIVHAEKAENDSDVILNWNTVTTDTLGNTENTDYYVVYRNTLPDFIPGTSDSISTVFYPETMYIDSGVLNASESYYYLVKAVDWPQHSSEKSNMGYVLDRFVNYNTDRSSRNWVSLPWHSDYSTVSDLVADLSPNGDPLESVTNLRDDMVEETWLYDTDFMIWYGPNNFIITPGRAYEMVAKKDTNLVLVGSNDPDGLISLNYNTDRSSRNWVSIPFNADYSTVDDIAQEYSPAGDPLESITNLRDDMVQETWLYDTDFMMWYGPNDFAIVPGRGYEFVPIKDTTWNPNEYSNEAFGQFLANKGTKRSDIEVYGGQSLEPDRAPMWTVKETEKRIDYSDSKNYMLVTERSDEKADYREPGISHIVRVHLSVKEFDNLVFTAYRPEMPYDVLTEKMIGSCVAIKGDQAAFFFNVANFKRPWQDEEEVIIIIEALKQGRGYFTVVNVFLDERVDVQDVNDITLMPIPEPVFTKKGLLHWSGVDDDNVVGYSLYESNKRLNERVLKRSCYSAKRDVNIRPVIRGGYETVYGSQGTQSRPDVHLPLSYAFNLFPNPFVTQTHIDYALPRQTSVEIVVYDISGRQVKTLANDMHNPGYYAKIWNGSDERSRRISSGIYFVLFKADDYKKVEKAILLK